MPHPHPGAPPGCKCRLCWLAAHDGEYQALWGLQQTAPFGARKLAADGQGHTVHRPPLPELLRRPACTHEEAIIESCTSCDKRLAELKHVRGCDIYERCVRDKRAGKFQAGLRSCHDCKDYNSEASPHLLRFDGDNLFAACPGIRMNPGLVEDRAGGYFISWRDGVLGSRTWVGRLDANFKSVGQARALDLAHPAAPNGQEDARLFWHRGSLHLSFVGVVRGRASLACNQLYARLSPALEVEAVFAPALAVRNPMEKNWAFFESGGDLFAVYSTAPHRILRIDGDRAEPFCETPTLTPWTSGECRGGASPVRRGDHFWHFFHSRDAYPRMHYNVGLAVFDAAPPFRVQRMTTSPILRAPQETWTKEVWHCPVIFPGGAVRRRDGWAVACGVHDSWVEFFEFKDADLEARLQRVAAPEWFRFTGCANEQNIFASLNVHDEYRLKELDLRGGAVLDVGAHVGSFAFAALEKGAAHVSCWEPVPETLEVLHANTARFANVAVHGKAVGRRGRGRVDRCANESTANRVAPDPAGPVEVVGLDEAIGAALREGGHERLRLLKIDCEGGEWDALWGCPAAALALVDAVAGEYHLPDPPDERRTQAALRAFLLAAGFAHVEVTAPVNGCNLFFARR